ncbi:MAG TPA: hypothetical protein DD477_09305 [Spirochaetaceae bacterium]|nr:hypothetical protein [Spirochaetaceae bacterium]
MTDRAAVLAIRGRTTYDGAGVRLQRIFGHDETSRFDPFLLLDAFGSDDPADYLPGFPMHPHRGIETVTYLLAGSVRHRDSLGNGGVIGPGDLQWMSAGSGIIHEEMPQASPVGVHGLQLWVNLAPAQKMRPPAYRGIVAAQVSAVPVGGGSVRLLAGEWNGRRGPVAGVAGDPAYLDVQLEAGSRFALDIASGRTAFAYLIDGSLAVAPPADAASGGGAGLVYHEAGSCLLLGDGQIAAFLAGPAGSRFIVAHAPPIGAPIAWGGPIVMNTQAELDTAFRELEAGTFIKTKPAGGG